MVGLHGSLAGERYGVGCVRHEFIYLQYLQCAAVVALQADEEVQDDREQRELREVITAVSGRSNGC